MLKSCLIKLNHRVTRENKVYTYGAPSMLVPENRTTFLATQMFTSFHEHSIQKSRLLKFCWASKGIFAAATNSTNQTNKQGRKYVPLISLFLNMMSMILCTIYFYEYNKLKVKRFGMASQWLLQFEPFLSFQRQLEQNQTVKRERKWKPDQKKVWFLQMWLSI